MRSVRSDEVCVPGRWRRRAGRVWLATILALGATATSMLLAGPAISAGARSIHGLATARLHLTRAEGSTLFESGPVSGVLVGRAQARLKTGASYVGEFTMTTSKGAITGVGLATPSKAGRYQSFRGSFRVLRGSGQYAHVHGEAALYGVFDRRTDSVVVQTVGTLTY
jgi:hypothetical protein